MSRGDYSHTQRGPIGVIVLGVAVLLAVVGLGVEEAPWIGPLLLAVAGVLFLLSFCFNTLTVEVGKSHLSVRFGPVALFRQSVPIDRIVSARTARSRLIDGWGVHWVPGRGWTWNLWGFDCVELEFDDGGLLRVGSNDAPALARALQERITKRAPTRN